MFFDDMYLALTETIAVTHVKINHKSCSSRLLHCDNRICLKQRKVCRVNLSLWLSLGHSMVRFLRE